MFKSLTIKRQLPKHLFLYLITKTKNRKNENLSVNGIKYGHERDSQWHGPEESPDDLQINHQIRVEAHLVA